MNSDAEESWQSGGQEMNEKETVSLEGSAFRTIGIWLSIWSFVIIFINS